MLHVPLDRVVESDLAALARDQISESVTLEFKKQLDLSAVKERSEISKDVSGMANAAGGRIVYGLDEIPRNDGSKVAGSICPLADGVVAESLENIIVSTIHPVPRYRIQRVEVVGGFVLVVEVIPSLGRDLHMATGYDDSRFYRRGERRVNRMSEPEIREAYARIAVSTAALEETMEKEVAAEIATRADAQESILVIPWYPRRNLADPRLLSGLGQALHNGPFRGNSAANTLKPCSDGMQGSNPFRPIAAAADFYFAIRRSGVIHLSWNDALRERDGKVVYYPMKTARFLAVALETAFLVLDRLNYWGPIRLIHHLWGPPDRQMFVSEVEAAAGLFGFEEHAFKSELSEAWLPQYAGDFEPLIREVLDQVFHAGGAPRCPWFDEHGRFVEPHRRRFIDARNAGP